MAIILRSVKGSNLTPTEVDGNFTDLDTRVIDLETNPPVPDEFSNITLSGQVMTFHLVSGGSFDLTVPLPKFRWRGAWLPNTSYLSLDGFTVTASGAYIVTFPHTSAASFDPEAVGSPVTAGSFVVGTVYKITTVGTTDFTLIGAATNTVGVEFTATGVGSGTGTASPRLYHLLIAAETLAAGSLTVSVPTEGGTTTAAEGEVRRLFNPAAALDAHLLILPPGTSDGQIYELMTRQVIAALSVLYDADESPIGPDDSPSGTTPFMLTPNGGASWIYSTSIADWTRRY